ncbi:hypothetical protein PR048_004247 [Dryococelus australis]|uniref:Uncharacterized protein n=1 Tax=Dryococelus australis TaxID=614101 RepID=A0ABQ9I4Y5_9NEOP|nr:hypothetical protein PR048_004247 [Dryococelus australis]
MLNLRTPVNIHSTLALQMDVIPSHLRNGISCAPFLAMRAFRQLAADEGARHPTDTKVVLQELIKICYNVRVSNCKNGQLIGKHCWRHFLKIILKACLTFEEN